MSPHKPVSGGAGTPAQLAESTALLSARSQELANVRAAAAKWQAGLAGIAGGITLFSIVKARTDITGLSSPWPWIVGVALALGLAASTLGAVAALRAAYGMPTLLKTGTTPLYTADHRSALRARTDLRTAIVLTLVSLATFAAALGMVWFAPEQSSDPHLKVVPLSGESACGTVVSVNGTTLTLKTSDGNQTFGLTTLRALSPVDSCS